jgi:glutamate-1-semialdehyde 2,1-aminomutase
MSEAALSDQPTQSQADYYEKAEAALPGAGLGGYSLPDDVRFIIQRGEGSRVLSVDGDWYIDYVGGAGANILGHAHPEVMAAVRPQIEKGLHFFGTLNDTAIELAETLVRLIPCADRVAFSSTGSEATFYAMRIARAYTGRQKILKFEGAYHGNHDYSSFSLFPTRPANYPVAPADSGGVPEGCSPPCWSPPTTTWRRSSASSPSTRTTSPPSSSRGCSA